MKQALERNLPESASHLTGVSLERCVGVLVVAELYRQRAQRADYGRCLAASRGAIVRYLPEVLQAEGLLACAALEWQKVRFDGNLAQRIARQSTSGPACPPSQYSHLSRGPWASKHTKSKYQALLK